MEERIARLEQFAIDTGQRLGRIETRLEQMVTKADLAAAIADLIKWMVGTAIVLGATAITVITFVLNYASPKAPAAQPAAIVIPLCLAAPTLAALTKACT